MAVNWNNLTRKLTLKPFWIDFAVQKWAMKYGNVCIYVYINMKDYLLRHRGYNFIPKRSKKKITLVYHNSIYIYSHNMQESTLWKYLLIQELGQVQLLLLRNLSKWQKNNENEYVRIWGLGDVLNLFYPFLAPDYYH